MAFLSLLLKKDIYTGTVHFYSTWKNMPPLHFHVKYKTMCSLMLELLASGQSAGTHGGNPSPVSVTFYR